MVRDETTHEAVIIVCANCGKRMKAIKLKGLSTEGLLCSRCAKGEQEGMEND